MRGSYVAVEEVKELENGEIEWTCASRSTPGGSIPTRLAESHMFVLFFSLSLVWTLMESRERRASSLATHIPHYFSWLKARNEKSPKRSPSLLKRISSITHTGHKRKLSGEHPVVVVEGGGER